MNLKANPDCCEEAALGIPFYTPCNKPATNVVAWKGRSDPAIRMCDFCTNHNVHNRGGYVVRAYQPEGASTVSNEPIPASNRGVSVKDNRTTTSDKIDYAGIETERLKDEYAGLGSTLERLRAENAAIAEVPDDATGDSVAIALGGIIKRARDLKAEAENTRIVEVEPNFRRYQAGNAFFNSLKEAIQPEDRKQRRTSPGLIDDAQGKIAAHQDRKEARERARLAEEQRVAEQARREAEERDRKAREASEKAEREAREAEERAARARTEESKKAREAEADAARKRESDAAAAAMEAEVTADKAAEHHADSRIATLATSADIVRTTGSAPEGGGVMLTKATEKIAELIDRSELDDASKLLLFEQATDAQVATMVSKFANATGHRTPLPGCLIQIRKKNVTR